MKISRRMVAITSSFLMAMAAVPLARTALSGPATVSVQPSNQPIYTNTNQSIPHLPSHGYFSTIIWDDAEAQSQGGPLECDETNAAELEQKASVKMSQQLEHFDCEYQYIPLSTAELYQNFGYLVGNRCIWRFEDLIHRFQTLICTNGPVISDAVIKQTLENGSELYQDCADIHCNFTWYDLDKHKFYVGRINLN